MSIRVRWSAFVCASRVALVTILSSCSSSNATSAVDSPEVVEFPADTPLGEQRPVAWSVLNFLGDTGPCTTLTTDDAFLIVRRNDVTGNALLQKWGHGAAAVAPVWSTELPFRLCQRVLAAPDGGAFVVAVSLDGFNIRIVRLGSDGSLRWDVTINGIETASAPLPSGDLAVFVNAAVTPSTSTTDLVMLAAADGKEKSRTHVSALPPSPRPPIINGVAVTPDGGIVGVTYASVLRFDAAGTLSWTNQQGEGANNQYTDVASLSDGSILVTGFTEDDNRFAQAVAVRYSGDGHLQWWKSYPDGKAPGIRFLMHLTTFDAIVSLAGGAASVVMHTLNGCRLLRLEPSGAISRVQNLDPSGTRIECSPRTLGADLSYFSGSGFSKMTP